MADFFDEIPLLLLILKKKKQKLNAWGHNSIEYLSCAHKGLYLISNITKHAFRTFPLETIVTILKN